MNRPPLIPGSASRIAVLALTAVVAVYVLGVLAVPWLESRGFSVAHAMRSAYEPVCHQNPERSLHLAGSPWTVCARCSGLYFGGLAGLVLCGVAGMGLIRRPSRRLLALAIAPIVIDALLPFVGLPQLSTLPRLILALPAGLMVGLFLGYAVADLMRSRTLVGTRLPLEEFDG